MADEKKNLRRILGECRGALSPDLAHSLSLQVQRRVLSSGLYRASRTVVLYSPKDNEVSTSALLEHSLSSGRRVLFPRISPENRSIALVPISRASQLKPGQWGILEPDGEAANLAEIADGLLCLPGLAFAPNGDRLGRGGGFYDRLLASLDELSPDGAFSSDSSRSTRHIRTAGLAYSFQLLNQLPADHSDRRVDFIFTESASYRGGHSVEEADSVEHMSVSSAAPSHDAGPANGQELINQGGVPRWHG